MQFLNEHNILYQKQFGFQKKFSTAHATIKPTIEDIEKSLDNKQSLCAIFIDLQKAFDTADHNILLNKLSIMEQEIQQRTGFLHILQIEISLLQSMVFILIYETFDSGFLKDQF